MALLCFVLDLRTLPPSLLRDLKQSLLQLANLYAILPARTGEEREPSEEEVCPLPDRIALCYLHRDSALLSDEDAAERCISVEFIVLEQDLYHGFSENLEQLVHNTSDLENCILRTYVPNSSVFCGLLKRWFQDLKNDAGEALLAIFLFKESIIGATKQIFCNLSASYNDILDGFSYCQACRCHGHPVRNTAGNKTNNLICPVTKHELAACELIENVVKVGEQTVLFMPSFQSFPELRQVTDPINFNVIERTNLATLDEVFLGLSRALSLLDQGLVCSSTFDTGKMKNVAFQCFYVLQPSDRGTMLLRRLAASEEIWPIPETISSNDITLPKEIEESVQASLSKLELKDYNPLLHEKGFHQKLNFLVKESLQFGSIPIEKVERSLKLRTAVEGDVLSQDKPSTTEISEEGIQPTGKEEQHSSITQDWEELLFVNDAKENYSPLCIARPKFEDLNLSSNSRPMDEKTSRILERLEVPKQKTPKQAMGTLPIVASNTVDGSVKRPLDAATLSPMLSQPIKPRFQRLKRKQR